MSTLRTWGGRPIIVETCDEPDDDAVVLLQVEPDYDVLLDYTTARSLAARLTVAANRGKRLAEERPT